MTDTHSNFADPKLIKSLSVLRPWRSGVALAFDWLVIAAAIAASRQLPGIWIYLVSVAVIAGRMHALGVLMHEAAHYRIVKNRRLNDWVGDVFIAWPILSTVQSYRRNHLAHHQHTNTEADPDWSAKLGDGAFMFPLQAWRLALQLGGYLIAINTVRELRQILPRLNRNNMASRLYRTVRCGFYLTLFVVFTVTGTWRLVLLYWLVPFFTLLFMFLYVRGVAEHFGGLNYEGETGGIRTVLPHLWERLFFAPHHINFHIEHHLYPSVPFYNLPKLHAALMKDGSYRSQAHVTRGYSTGLLRECLSASVVSSPSLKVEG